MDSPSLDSALFLPIIPSLYGSLYEWLWGLARSVGLSEVSFPECFLFVWFRIIMASQNQLVLFCFSLME